MNRENGRVQTRKLGALRPGDRFAGPCVIRAMEVKWRRNGMPFLVLELGDASGRLKGRLWDNAPEQAERFRAGMVVVVEGRAGLVGGRLDLTLTAIRPAEAGDEITPEQLLAHSARTPAELRTALGGFVDRVEDDTLRAMLTNLMDAHPLAERFFLAPGGKLWHHNRLGGLAEHLLGVLALVETLCSTHPRLRRDILVTGAICRLWGEAAAFRSEGYIDISDGGRLVGRRVLADSALRNCWTALGEEIRLQVRHMVVCGEGEGEVAPSTPEALALVDAIRLDRQADAACRLTVRRDFLHPNWTGYVPLLKRSLYLGSENAPVEETSQSATHPGFSSRRGCGNSPSARQCDGNS